MDLPCCCGINSLTMHTINLGCSGDVTESVWRTKRSTINVSQQCQIIRNKRLIMSKIEIQMMSIMNWMILELKYPSYSTEYWKESFADCSVWSPIWSNDWALIFTSLRVLETTRQKSCSYFDISSFGRKIPLLLLSSFEDVELSCSTTFCLSTSVSKILWICYQQGW